MEPNDRELVFLVNGKSRSGATEGEAARDALVSAGFNVSDFVITSTKSDFESRLRSSIEQGVLYIAIGGGDGTQRAAAETMAGTGATMVVVPMGTGNAWAKDLGIPVDKVEMAKKMATAVPQLIDLGEANGKGFVNVATVGLTSLIVKNMPKGLKGRFGRLVYFPAVIRSLKEMRPFTLSVKTEGDAYNGRALQFVAAPGRTHAGPFRVTRHSRNDDGLFSLYALDDTDNKGIVRFALGLVTGTHTLMNEVWSTEAASAIVETSPTKRVIVDGEPEESTPLRLSMRAQALRVLVPSE
jgi:YegS/Rv2252/BmrU family lipid kinase